MKKADREKVFNKYGGKCAYCGCQLVKGWHVDHLEPVIRLTKSIGNTYQHKVTGAIATPRDAQSDTFLEEFEWVERKVVPNGFEKPERDCMENYMPACASCNINKHSADLESFRRLITGFMKHLNEVSTQYKIAKRYGLVVEETKPVVFYFETL